MYKFSRSSNQASFRADRPITVEEIQHYAPSVMTDTPHQSRAQSYKVISTFNVLESMQDEGFFPYEVRQTRVRDQNKREFTRHMVRLRHINNLSNGHEVPEIVLLNSHDGTSSYQLMSGIFRMVCSNGLIAGSIFDDIRIRHSGNVIDNVIEGSYRVLSDIEAVQGRVERYKNTQLSIGQKVDFAKQAIELRWGEDSPIQNPERVLNIHRGADRSSDLWTTYNVIQENIVRGGLAGRSETGRRMTTRAVGGVNELVRLNRGLWDIADKMAA